MGLRTEPGKFFHTELIHVFMEHAVGTGAQSCWNGKEPSSNFVHRAGSLALSKMSWYTEALRLPFTGSKGPSSNPEKQSYNIIPSEGI